MLGIWVRFFEANFYIIQKGILSFRSLSKNIRQTIQIQNNRAKEKNKRQGANARQSFKADKSTAGKGDQRTADKGTAKPTKTLTEVDKSGQERTDKGTAKDYTKTKEPTQSWQRLGQSQNLEPKADMADKWQGLETRPKRPQGAHNADKRPTCSGDAARAYRGQPFFPKREPHSELFGEKESRDFKRKVKRK